MESKELKRYEENRQASEAEFQALDDAAKIRQAIHAIRAAVRDVPTGTSKFIWDVTEKIMPLLTPQDDEGFDLVACEKAFDELYRLPGSDVSRDDHHRAKLLWTFGDGARWMFHQLRKGPR